MRTILVVAGAPESRERLVDILAQASYEVVGADSFESALNLAPSVLPDLILMAIVMPGLNGLEAAALLRRQPESRSVPIILLGSMPPLGINDEPLASLVNGYLNFDVSQEELLEFVSKQFAVNGR